MDKGDAGEVLRGSIPIVKELDLADYDEHASEEVSDA